MRFLGEIGDNPSGKISTEDMLEIAAAANGFVQHPYWIRMARMLANTERAEMENLLNPTTPPDHQAMSRASVANIRRILNMPYVDIEQGDQAVRVVERHQAVFSGVMQ